MVVAAAKTRSRRKPAAPAQARETAKCTIVLEDADLRIPSWVVDLESFSRWADSDEFPEQGRISYLQGEVWVDMSRQQLFSHVKVKAKLTQVLFGLVEAGRLGEYFGDGARVCQSDTNMSVVPDGSFVSKESFESGRVKLIEGALDGYVELEGSPDMVLEIVSDSSVRKDTVRLRELYWEAGVREYWLADARKDPVSFDILHYTAKGYVAARKQGGWIKSAVFGKAFRFSRTSDELGHPQYTLEVR